MFAKFKRWNFHAVSHLKRNASCDLITENNGRNSWCRSRLRHLRLNIGRVLGHLSRVTFRIRQFANRTRRLCRTQSYLWPNCMTIPVEGWRHKQPSQFGRTDPFHLRHGLSGRQVLVNGRRPYSISTCIDHFLPAIFSGCFPFSLKRTDMKLIPNVSSVHVLEFCILISLEWKTKKTKISFYSDLLSACCC